MTRYRVTISYDANGQYWTAVIPITGTSISAATKTGLKAAVEEHISQYLDDRDAHIVYEQKIEEAVR